MVIYRQWAGTQRPFGARCPGTQVDPGWGFRGRGFGGGDDAQAAASSASKTNTHIFFIFILLIFRVDRAARKIEFERSW